MAHGREARVRFRIEITVGMSAAPDRDDQEDAEDGDSAMRRESFGAMRRSDRRPGTPRAPRQQQQAEVDHVLAPMVTGRCEPLSSCSLPAAISCR